MNQKFKLFQVLIPKEFCYQRVILTKEQFFAMNKYPKELKYELKKDMCRGTALLSIVSVAIPVNLDSLGSLSAFCLISLAGGSGVGPGGLAQAQAFASLIGQEVAAAYHQRTAMNTQVPGSQIIQPIIVIPPSLNPHAGAAAPHMGFVHPMAPSHLHQPLPMSQSPVPSTSHVHTPEPPQPPKTPPNTIAAVREAAARELAAREVALQQAALRELAMSHQWVDTVQVARRIKDILADNNIGQRLFGEVVLNMSQGSVSDLLSRPKPWDKMTAKGREPFIKMLQFLSSHHHLERLKIINLQKKGNSRKS